MSKWEQRISDRVLQRIRSKRAESENTFSAKSGAGRVHLREAAFSDCAAVSELKVRHSLSPDSPANWERIWRNNPALAHFGKVPMGWVLEGDEGIVGYLGNIPLRAFYQGRPLRVATTHALVVERNYRAYAAGLVSAYFRQPGIDLFVSTSTSESAGKMYEAFRGQVLPQADYDTVLFWILDRARFLSSVTKKLHMEGAAARAGAKIGSWALRVDQAFRRPHRQKGAGLYDSREISPSEIDNDFDVFWQRILAATPRLVADRSAAALRWHFDVSGDQRKPVVLRCDRDGRLAGYAVVLTDTSADGLRQASIGDLLVEDEDPRVLDQILSAVLGYARRTGHHVLEVLGFPRAIRALCREQRPYNRKFPSHPYFFKAANGDLRGSLASEDEWYATPYDGDATLMPRLQAQSAALEHDRYQLA